jgi:hypothetical protein
MRAPPRRTTKKTTAKKSATQKASFALGNNHAMEVTAGTHGAHIRVSSPLGGTGIEVEIVMTDHGPSLRLRAPSMELVADENLVARCKNFSLDASERVSIRAGKEATVEGSAVTVKARTGMAKVHANDDVQLMGEQVLLNCERQATMPSWVHTAPAPALLSRNEADGDAELLARITGAKP